MKICKSCDIDKDLSEFYNNPSCKDGLTTICKDCHRLRYYKYNKKEKVIKEIHIKKDKIIDKIKYHRDYNKKYFQLNKSKILLYKKEYRENNKQYYIIRNIVNRLIRYKNVKKIQNTENLLGYGVSDFKNQFPCISKGSHIDHKIPVSWFKPSTPVSIVNDLRNLHLLNAKTNQSKLNLYCDAIPREYFNIILTYLKSKYIEIVKINLVD